VFDRKTLEELYDYTDFSWAMIARTCSALPEGTLAKAAPGAGWPALRDAFQHVLGAIDGWLHYTLELAPLINPPAEQLGAWSGIQAYREQVRATFRRVLDETPDEKLFEPFTRTYDEDGPETMSLGDILANLLLHERGHHGDFNTLFWQLGIEQPGLDYRQYVYLKRNPESPYRPAGW
jgi:uncharacterized damage-inducible protein DinB